MRVACPWISVFIATHRVQRMLAGGIQQEYRDVCRIEIRRAQCCCDGFRLFHRGELARYDEALAACDAALALQPDMAEAWFGRGFIFAKLRRPAEAATAYLRARALNPELPLLKGNLLHQKMLICDWSGRLTGS